MLTVLVILVILLSGCGGYALRANLTRHQQATVKVIVKCIDSEQEYSGSGVVISDRRVLTAAHLVEVCPLPDMFILDDETMYPVYPAKVDVDNDLAILVNVGPVPFKKPSINYGPEPKRMSRIYLITGAPYEDVRDGILNHWNIKEGPRIKHSIVTERGNSGSGVYDYMGRLIGILTHATFCGNGQYCGGRASSLWDKKDWLE